MADTTQALITDAELDDVWRRLHVGGTDGPYVAHTRDYPDLADLRRADAEADELNRAALRGALHEPVAQWRARWVAEAMEELAREPHPVSRIARVLLEERAAEYRKGKR